MFSCKYSNTLHLHSQTLVSASFSVLTLAFGKLKLTRHECTKLIEKAEEKKKEQQDILNEVNKEAKEVLGLFFGNCFESYSNIFNYQDTLFYIHPRLMEGKFKVYEGITKYLIT